jgi:CubicO group peptidase (beta-lactamase class C family)
VASVRLLLVVIALASFPLGSFAQDITVASGLEVQVEEFAADLDSLRHAHHLPGLAAAIVRARELLWFHGYGFAYVDDEVSITPDTPFWIASVTKTFVGLVFLQLEADGIVHLEDEIRDVPGWEGFCSWLSSSTLPFGRDLRCNAPITVRHVLNHTVQGEPGTRFLYNPVMYSRLSRYLEHVTGGSVDEVEGRQNALAQAIEERILTPAGMSRTMSSQWQREKMDVFFDMAQGYGIDAAGEFVIRPRPEREIAGGAGIVSTVEDLARHDAALDAGKLATPEVMAKLFSPARAPDGTLLPYAHGWYVQAHRGTRLVWHSGWDAEAGFSALYLKVPDRRLTLILLSNGEGLWWENPLDSAAVDRSPFARAFLDRFASE